MRHLKMKKHASPGVLITFCGLDGCGKTTMIKLLKEKLELEGKQVFLTKQPTEIVRKSEIFRCYMDALSRRSENCGAHRGAGEGCS